MSVRPATLAALLLAVLALLFAACGDDETTGGSGADARRPRGAATEDRATPDGEEGESEEEREREEAEAREAGGKDVLRGRRHRRRAQERQPPDDVAILDGAKVYESEGPFGKTERFFAAVDGEPERAAGQARRRRRRARAGRATSSAATDQEENTEAEAHLEGNEQTVDIQVITLCKGKLRIRYTVVVR